MGCSRIILFSLLFFISSKCEGVPMTKAEVIKALCIDYFSVRSVAIISRDIQRYDLINTQKGLSRFGMASAIVNPGHLIKGLKSWTRPMVVVLDGSDITLVERSIFSYDNWLIFAKHSLNVTKVNIPYNKKFLVITNDMDSFALQELFQYTPSDRLRTNNLGFLRNGVITPSLTFFYNRRFDFEGAPLRYLTTDISPCLSALFDGSKVFLCIQFKIWKIFMDRINATATPVFSESKNPNHILEIFAKGGAIASINGLMLVSFTVALFDFVWPTFKSDLDVHTRYLGLEVDWDRYLQPYSMFIWMVIVLWILFSCLIISIVKIILTGNADLDDGNFRPEQKWTPLFAFLNQGSTEPAESTWERLILFSLYAAPAILLPAYSGALTSFLAIQVPIAPFTDLEGMRNYPEYKLTGTIQYDTSTLFWNKEDELSKHLYNHAMLPISQKPKTDLEGIERMCKEKLSFIQSKYALVALRPSCKYYKLSKPLSTYHQSMVLPKNSPYKAPLDILSRRIRFSGILLNLKFSSARAELSPLFKRNLVPSELPPISTEDVAILFSLLAFAILQSFVTLLCELIIAKIKRRAIINKHLQSGKKRIVRFVRA